MASTARPDTAEKPSGKKTKKLSQEEQSERFKEAARELEVDESGSSFEKATEKIMPPRLKPQDDRAK